MAKASRLDPSWGKNFNEPTIKHYFGLIQEVEEKYGPIPSSHIWNMDEKGIQLGGGQKQGQKKFFFLKSWKW